MAVRRLYEPQPDRFAFTPENLAWAQATIAKYPQGREASAVIPLLWRAQEQEGWVTKPAIEAVADMLRMPTIRVLEVATFYTMFQLQPVGRRAHIQVCGTTPCMLRGAEDLIAVCRRKIALHAHEVSPDGAFSWEEMECLGACVNAPMIQIGKDTYEDLTPQVFEAMIDFMAAGGEPVPGPHIARQFSAPASGLTTLTEIDYEALAAEHARRSRQALETAASAAPAEPAPAQDGAAIPEGAPRPAVADSAGGVPLAADQARWKGESISAGSGGSDTPPSAHAAREQEAAKPTSTGRPDEEAARSRPTDAEAGEKPAKPRKRTTRKRAADEARQEGAAGTAGDGDPGPGKGYPEGAADSTAPGWSPGRKGEGEPDGPSPNAPKRQKTPIRGKS